MQELLHVENLQMADKTKIRIGSLDSSECLIRAADIISSGGVVVAQMRSVFGIWVDASNDEAVRRLHEVKGTPRDKPLSAMMFWDDLLYRVDSERVSPLVRPLFINAKTLNARLGSICHLRVPINSVHADSLPRSLLSYDRGVAYVHNLDPQGHAPITDLIKAFKDRGVEMAGVTSLNDHRINEPEICELDRAIQFANSQNVELLLSDPQSTYKAVGSFSIVDVENVKAVREGHIPIALISILMGCDIDITSMKLGNHDIADLMDLTSSVSDPVDLRNAILKYFSI